MSDEVFEALRELESLPRGSYISRWGAAQSPALIQQYQEMLGMEPTLVLFAHHFWTDRTNTIDEYFYRVRFPSRGSVFVGLGGAYHERWGHAGIITGIASNGSLRTLEQNGGPGLGTGIDTHVRSRNNGIIGFLHPKERRLWNTPGN